MAARKSPSKKVRPVWESGPDDAIRLAALRWFSLELERLSIQIYASDKAQFKNMERVFRHALSGMAALCPKKVKPDFGGDDGCPDGYILCKDGLCAPMCDVVGSE
jgi:hypothetical protein